MPQYQLALVHDGRADWTAATTVETIPLTTRQLRALAFVRQHLAGHGHAPTHRQIAEAAGLSSASSVHHQLGRLQALGYLRRATGRVRALSPVRAGELAGRAPLRVIDGGRT